MSDVEENDDDFENMTRDELIELILSLRKQIDDDERAQRNYREIMANKLAAYQDAIYLLDSNAVVEE